MARRSHTLKSTATWHVRLLTLCAVRIHNPNVYPCEFYPYVHTDFGYVECYFFFFFVAYLVVFYSNNTSLTTFYTCATPKTQANRLLYLPVDTIATA